VRADHRGPYRSHSQRNRHRQYHSRDRCALPESAIVVAGFRLPAIEAALANRAGALSRFRYLMQNESELQQLRQEGHDVFHADREIERYQTRVNGLRPRDKGARLLAGN
jgi:hypothetical protein